MVSEHSFFSATKNNNILSYAIQYTVSGRVTCKD